MTNWASSKKHTFTLGKNALTYVYLPVFNLEGGYAGFAVGVSAEGDAEDVCSLVPFKTNPGNAKLFKATVNTKGTAKATIGEKQVDVKWIQLWENGPKFAEYNVGVTDGKAESYGAPYGWGSIIGWDKEGEYNDGGIALTGDYDTATKLWGSAWRMPTKAEFDALIDNCNVKWTVVNGVEGAKITGKDDYAYNSIFLPASGIWRIDEFDERTVTCYYWSSTPSFDGQGDIDSGDYAYYLDVSEAYNACVAYYDRWLGFSVRAVLKE